ncbi:MAG: MerR family transcriptional regulator [Alphaproteobacteria bacterium]|nr:MerR family transcriptional regulator [Alphaproteobacteria bacterium]
MTDIKYKNISEVAETLNIKNHTLRFWEKKFPYFNPKKINGVRYYSEKDISYLKQIQVHLKEKGYTIKGVSNIIKTIGIESFRNIDMDLENSEELSQKLELPVLNEVEDNQAESITAFNDTLNKKTEKIQDIIHKLKKIRDAL